MGNTKVVDLGYLDATYMTLMSGASRTLDLTTQRAYMSDIRQRMVDAGLNDGVNWSLSRIGFDAGVVNSLYHSGCYVIAIKHLVAGVPSGDEWLLNISSAGSSSLSNLAYTVGTTSGQCETYFYFSSASIWNTGSSTGAFFLDYNPDGNTDSWDITSIRTNLPGFMPSTVKPRGLTTPLISITSENATAFVFNHAAKVCGIVMSELGVLKAYLYSGRILTPKRSLDVYDFGGIYGLTSYNTAANSAVVTTVNDAGTPITCNLQTHELFLTGNQPYNNGSELVFQRDKPIVYNSTYIKGELRPDLFPIQGGHDRHYTKMFQSEHGRALKINDVMCIPWADDVPPPFSGWPLNPQIPTVGP